MGYASLILGIVAVCICWVPQLGWLGVALSLVAGVIGVPCVTHRYAHQGYTGWGIAGIGLGFFSFSIGVVFQIKHAGAALDGVLGALPVPQAWGAIGGSALLFSLAMVAARRWPAKRTPWAAVAVVAVVICYLAGATALETADRAYQARTAPGADQANESPR